MRAVVYCAWRNGGIWTLLNTLATQFRVEGGRGVPIVTCSTLPLLVQQIRPTGTIAEASKRSPESILRDQFGALVTERYDHLLVLSTVALGHKKASQSIPALRSVEHSASQKAPTETPK